MKATYDKESDAFYVRFSNSKITESEEIRPGLILDFDAEGRIVSIELLDAHTQLPPEALPDIKAA
ncbi:MAG: DUF2283 domain-containing protein [Beijerinckiaceae bacterium]|nr:DUF2283 domain-containing protein [Beijerinckiaceae bacterium]MCI0736502.1 DUF2283 domain-containing protein [Beijerinckiaceae bacterium]